MKDEDFNPLSFGISMDIEEDLAKQSFEEAIEVVQNHHNRLQNKKGYEDTIPFFDDDNKELDIIKAINNRLQLSKV